MLIKLEKKYEYRKVIPRKLYSLLILMGIFALVNKVGIVSLFFTNLTFLLLVKFVQLKAEL